MKLVKSRSDWYFTEYSYNLRFVNPLMSKVHIPSILPPIFYILSIPVCSIYQNDALDEEISKNLICYIS